LTGRKGKYMPRFVALYMGWDRPEDQAEWNALSPAEQAQRQQDGMTAWGQWVERHQAAIVDMGSPLGKTLMASPAGVTSTRNAVAAYVIVEATSHDEAARMFENHPHFSILPGRSVEILECLPMPGAPG
jgi:hypothetical protein